MDIDWRTAVLLVTGLPSILAAFFALTMAREPVAARFFTGLIVAWVLLTVPYIIGFSGAYQAYPQLTFAPFNTELWLGPLWLLTVRGLTGDALKRRWWLWLVPGVIQTTYYTACFFLIGPDFGLAFEAGAEKFAFNDAFHEPYIIPIETVLSLVLIAIAVADSWIRMRRYRVWITEEHSNRERVDLSWVERSGLMMIALAALWLAVDLSQAVFGRFSYSTNFWFYALGGAVVLGLTLQFLARSDRQFPKQLETSERGANEVRAAEPESAARTVDLEAITQQVREGEWYLDQDLTLDQLARRLGTNKSSLSAVLNERDDMSFNLFVNGLRVDAMCERLRAHAGAGKGSPNFLSLAFDCGFGSKATFNRAFKRRTGQAPREWMSALENH